MKTQAITDALERAKNNDLNAFLSISETAFEDAKQANGPLAGLPIAIKDNMCQRGTKTTAGSKALENFISPYTATAVTRLQKAGAVIIGKTNLDEFAMGSSGENSAFGPTKNPWDKTRIPGGSSSGSAAAVAAGIVPVALGSDTGGSIRQPAALSGTIGMKPTYGRVSRHGLIAFASSLDQIGAFSLSTENLAQVFDVICGHDPLDSTSLQVENNFVKALGANVRNLKIGLVKEAETGNSPGVEGAMQAAQTELEKLGLIVKEVSLPSLKLAISAYYLIACPEASSNLARYDGMIYSHRNQKRGELEEVMTKSRSESFGAEVRRRILIGTYALSSGYFDAYYSKSLKVRALIAREFAKAFEEVDVLLMPTTPAPAFKIGEKNCDPVSMYLSDIYTVSVNLAGLPGISIPFGFEKNGSYDQTSGLPVGIQLITKALNDELLISLSNALEKSTDKAFLRPAH